MSENSECPTEGTMAATSRVWREVSPPASELGTYPDCSTACATRARVASATSSGRCSAREAVMGDTPAMRARSLRVGALALRGRRLVMRGL
jgi:hypothetical protein